MSKHFGLEENEDWVKSETCTYQNARKEFVEGIICLTTRQFFYASTSKYFAEQSLSIPITDIQSVEPHLTLGITPNGIKITTKDDKTDHFVVSDQKSWVEEINNQL